MTIRHRLYLRFLRHVPTELLVCEYMRRMVLDALERSKRIPVIDLTEQGIDTRDGAS